MFLPFGSKPAEGTHSPELRASASGRLRPADGCAIEPCGIGACCNRPQPSGQLRFRGAACEGTRVAPLRRAQLRPADVCDVDRTAICSARGRRPHCAQFGFGLQPSGWALRSQRAALRQGAAAGCTHCVRIPSTSATPTPLRHPARRYSSMLPPALRSRSTSSSAQLSRIASRIVQRLSKRCASTRGCNAFTTRITSFIAG